MIWSIMKPSEPAIYQHGSTLLFAQTKHLPSTRQNRLTSGLIGWRRSAVPPVVTSRNLWTRCGTATASLARTAQGCPITVSRIVIQRTAMKPRRPRSMQRPDRELLRPRPKRSSSEVSSYDSLANLMRKRIGQSSCIWEHCATQTVEPLNQLGPDTGFDSIGDWPRGEPLVRYLDQLESRGKLPRMILYNLNPNDNYLLATMVGNFQSGSTPGKLQFGTGWGFLDQKEAIEWQLNALSNCGLLGHFVCVF